MDMELLKQARERVRQRFGAAIAGKATAEFCAAFGGLEMSVPAVVGRSHVFALEQMGVGSAVDFAAPRSVVLEFKPRGEEEQSLKRVRTSRSPKKASADLESRTVEVREQVQEGQVSRAREMQEARDQFYRQVADVRLEIERGARNFHRPGPESSVSPQLPSDVAELCWLNESVRTWTDPRSLAEVAADPHVRQVDLPRRLSPDMIQLGEVSEIPQYRQRSGLTGKGVRVAIIDSEVAKKHPAFQERVIPQQNYSREPWGSPDGHGTAVAGIIGGRDAGFEGIAPEVTMYNYKVFTTNRFLSGDDFDGALSLQKALEDGAQIANCSWGAGEASDGTSREAKACNAAWRFGMIVVKSAGNEGPGAKTLTSPADAEGVIVVGGTDLAAKVLADYSSRGPTKDGKQRPHILGVGGTVTDNIVSCLVAGGYGPCGYGTSFAAPYITGIVALLIERNAKITPDQLRTDLLSLGTKLSGVAAGAQGAGFVSLKSLP